MRFLKHITVKFDFVFVIKGAYINERHCLYLKEKHKSAIFILYLWDSLVRIEGINNILPFFDRILSFDTLDVKKYGFTFRPIFFRKEILSNSSDVRNYDISFVGWAHSDRIALINDIRLLFLKKGYKLSFHIYIGKIKKIILLISGKIKRSDMPLFITKPLDFVTYCKIVGTSRCILDIHHPNQSGLTMRSIEALAAGCFLITTNYHITEYIDIPKKAYFLLNRKSIANIDNLDVKNILNMTYVKNIQGYSLNSFINDVFML
jgi:hypothetical protein